VVSAPLWQCPQCDRTFANRNQTHTCARLADLDAHFARAEPHVRKLFDAFADAVRANGEVDILPEKTRIAFHVRMSFAQLSVRRSYLVGHLVLARRIDDPRFTKVETFSPRNHLHAFRLDRAEELDEQFRGWIAEAYAVGLQRHLAR